VKNQPKPDPFEGLKPIYRLGVVMIGLAAISISVLRWLRNGMNCENYWGQVVFAPFGVLIGVLMIVAVVVGWFKGK
jgi:hypothetical protein